MSRQESRFQAEKGCSGSPFLLETKSRDVNDTGKNAKKDMELGQPDHSGPHVTAIIRRSDESTADREFRESYEATNSKP